jgi:hypothetical protein
MLDRRIIDEFKQSLGRDPWQCPEFRCTRWRFPLPAPRIKDVPLQPVDPIPEASSYHGADYEESHSQTDAEDNEFAGVVRIFIEEGSPELLECDDEECDAQNPLADENRSQQLENAMADDLPSVPMKSEALFSQNHLVLDSDDLDECGIPQTINNNSNSAAIDNTQSSLDSLLMEIENFVRRDVEYI